jgi:hypothetical protein
MSLNKTLTINLCSTVLLAMTVLPANAIDCEKFLRMHGMASRAQFQCGFKSYNKEIIAQAKVCNGYLSEERVEENIKAGMKIFDDNVANLGKQEACDDVLNSLPMVVRK